MYNGYDLHQIRRGGRVHDDDPLKGSKCFFTPSLSLASIFPRFPVLKMHKG
jgi:hypothetical protein